MTEQSLIQNWQNIIWREWYHCHDKDYARRLYKAVYHGPLSWFKRVRLSSQSRPYAAEVEIALRQACAVRRGAKHVWERRLYRLDQAKQKSTSLEKLIANLQDHHWLERFVARHVLLHRGGEAVKPLQALAQDSPIALWLLQSIGADTTARLAQDAANLLCPHCLVYCYPHTLRLPEPFSAKYYGCRACGQSQTFKSWPGRVVAVLDTGLEVEQIEQNDLLRVNYFQRRSLFDFDDLEIIQATDENVERFAVRVGNDTDPFRKPRYKQMLCIVSPECELSKNTLRILESMFGAVEQMNESPDPNRQISETRPESVERVAESQ